MKVRVNREGFKRLRTMTEALMISHGDFAGPVLIKLGGVHRKQQGRIFASQGSEGGAGRWQALNPRYAARKRSVVGSRKILVLTGDTKARFTQASSPYYIQRFVPTSKDGGVYQFGAHSDVAAAHLHGNPALAPLRSGLAHRAFGGKAPRLPIRDMIRKTTAQVAEFKAAVIAWYRTERIPQVIRHLRR